MKKLVSWSPDGDYEEKRCNKTLDERSRLFMRFFKEQFGVKFVDEETGKEIKVEGE